MEVVDLTSLNSVSIALSFLSRRIPNTSFLIGCNEKSEIMMRPFLGADCAINFAIFIGYINIVLPDFKGEKITSMSFKR